MTARVKILLISMPLVIVAGVGAGTTFVRIRQSLAEQRGAIAEEWSRVDQSLRERAVLIRNLAEAAKGRDAQADVLQDIAEARTALLNASLPQDKIHANDRLSNGLARLLVASESRPGLRSDSTFLELQDEIKRSDDRVAVARLKYNDSLEHYNARIQTFPNNLVARISGFKRNDEYFKTVLF